MKKINILLIYTGRRGGGSIYSFEMARALNNNAEINLKAVVSTYQDNISSWEQSDINLYQIKTYNDQFSFIFSSLNIPKFFKLRREILNFKPDIIYYPMLHMWTPIFNLILPQVPRVVTIHDPVQRLWERNPIHLVQPFVFKQADYFILLSDKFKQDLLSRNIATENIEVIPHGIFDYYLQDNNSKQTEKRKKTILFFGKIKPYKGLNVLLKAYPLLKDKYQEIRLVIAGAGNISEYERQLKGLTDVYIDNRWLTDVDVDHYFKEADVVVLPYLDASQSGIIPIAYAYGLPVVVSNVGGLGEQVIEGETGFLVEADNEQQLMGATLKLLKDDKLRQLMGKKAKEYAVNNWGWDKLADRLLNIFYKLRSGELE